MFAIWHELNALVCPDLGGFRLAIARPRRVRGGGGSGDDVRTRAQSGGVRAVAGQSRGVRNAVWCLLQPDGRWTRRRRSFREQQKSDSFSFSAASRRLLRSRVRPRRPSSQ